MAVFEQRGVIGGAAVSEPGIWPGYTLSTASYVCSLLDPWLVDELALRERGLSYYRKDPYAFTPLLDGRSLLLGTDRDATRARLRRSIRATSPGSTPTWSARID